MNKKPINPFASPEKILAFDIITSGSSNKLSAKDDATLTEYFTSSKSGRFIIDVLGMMNLYRPALLEKFLNIAIVNNKISPRNNRDLSFILTEYALSNLKTAPKKLVKWVKNGQLDPEPVREMIYEMTRNYINIFLTSAHEIGLLEEIGMGDQELIRLAYDSKNYMQAFYLETKGIHLENNDYSNAQWFTPFQSSDEDQMKWLSHMPQFGLSADDLSFATSHPSDQIFKKLNLLPRICFLAMCAADFYCLKLDNGKPRYFNDQRTVLDSQFTTCQLQHKKLSLQLSDDQIILVSDEGFLFELFVTRLFMQFFLSKKEKFSVSLADNYDVSQIAFDCFPSDSPSRKTTLSLLSDVLETLKTTSHHRDTVKRLSSILDAVEGDEKSKDGIDDMQFLEYSFLKID